jgi:hypothetical protein
MELKRASKKELPVLGIWRQYKVHVRASMGEGADEKRNNTGYLRKILAKLAKREMRGLRVGPADLKEGSIIVSFNDSSRQKMDEQMKAIKLVDRVEILRNLALVIRT